MSARLPAMRREGHRTDRSSRPVSAAESVFDIIAQWRLVAIFSPAESCSNEQLGPSVNPCNMYRWSASPKIAIRVPGQDAARIPATAVEGRPVRERCVQSVNQQHVERPFVRYGREIGEQARGQGRHFWRCSGALQVSRTPRSSAESAVCRPLRGRNPLGQSVDRLATPIAYDDVHDNELRARVQRCHVCWRGLLPRSRLGRCSR